MHNTEATCSESAERNARKVVQRFGENVLAQQLQAENTENHFEEICFKVFTIKFKQLFAYAGKHCSCHNRLLNHKNLFEHEGHKFEQWLDRLPEAGNLRGKKKANLAVIRRRANDHFVQRLLERAEEITNNPQKP